MSPTGNFPDWAEDRLKPMVKSSIEPGPMVMIRSRINGWVRYSTKAYDWAMKRFPR
jgi:hypothetical protein